MWWRAALVGLVLWGGYNAWQMRAVAHAAGEVAPDDPIQIDVRGDLSDIELNGFVLSPQARYDIEARVLGSQSYRTDTLADIAPVDLALGWGAMSDSEVLADIEISQGNRFYFWRVDEFPVARKVIETSSANVHMIPADRDIESRLKKVREGEVVHITGLLVNVRRSDGFNWKTSLTRNDVGAGACETIYVTELEVR